MASKLGLTLQVQYIRTVEDITLAFSAGTRAGAQGVLVTQESMFVVHRALVSELAARHRMPAIYGFVLSVTDAGGLMAYTANTFELHRQSAAYVDRILKGARPSDLPVQQPMRFDMVINLKTAKGLGLKIPPSVLARATEVIE